MKKFLCKIWLKRDFSFVRQVVVEAADGWAAEGEAIMTAHEEDELITEENCYVEVESPDEN